MRLLNRVRGGSGAEGMLYMGAARGMVDYIAWLDSEYRGGVSR